MGYYQYASRASLGAFYEALFLIDFRKDLRFYLYAGGTE
jgi:hypothetical protein